MLKNGSIVHLKPRLSQGGEVTCVRQHLYGLLVQGWKQCSKKGSKQKGTLLQVPHMDAGHLLVLRLMHLLAFFEEFTKKMHLTKQEIESISKVLNYYEVFLMKGLGYTQLLCAETFLNII